MARMKEMRVNIVDALGQESFDAPIQKGTIDSVQLRDQFKAHVEMVESISRQVRTQKRGCDFPPDNPPEAAFSVPNTKFLATQEDGEHWLIYVGCVCRYGGSMGPANAPSKG